MSGTSQEKAANEVLKQKNQQQKKNPEGKENRGHSPFVTHATSAFTQQHGSAGVIATATANAPIEELGKVLDPNAPAVTQLFEEEIGPQAIVSGESEQLEEVSMDEDLKMKVELGDKKLDVQSEK